MKKIHRHFLRVTLATAITGMAFCAPVAAAETIHRVQPGESLWSIARQHHMNVDTLARLNGINNSDYITAGMKLKLANPNQIYTVKSGDSLWSIARKFGVNYQELVKFNGLGNPDQIRIGMKIKIPNTTSSNTQFTQQRFIWPLKGRISSYFGRRWGRNHEGIDIAVPIGRNVVAAASGKVVWSGWIRGYGHSVIVQHDDGYRTLYAHNHKLLVRSGKWVSQGQAIAISGNSGRSTGPHLHFEVQKNGKPQNPMNYLP